MILVGPPAAEAAAPCGRLAARQRGQQRHVEEASTQGGMIRLYNPAAAGQRMGISIDTVRPGSLSDGFRHSAVRNSPERGPGRVLAGKQVGSFGAG